ncbi:glutathione peroxidase [Limnobacter sp.]|uniref:glutathione peroxidase n=1 Tax=Limnobacter sp. TaxID=2003368 RepID=UPI002589BDAD|nr:glutathione peroxidase [Limnobacter sp.]
MSAPIYSFSSKTLQGKPIALADYEGKVLLIVNTASKCGFTPQYAGLQALHDKYAGQGLVVIGFPCNQFGKQEPGGSEEIAGFCDLNYGVTFTMSDKVDVNGADAHPLYKFLTAEAKGILGSEAIKWNFTKFLVRKNGDVFKRYAPTTKPADLAGDIEKLLAE